MKQITEKKLDKYNSGILNYNVKHAPTNTQEKHAEPSSHGTWNTDKTLKIRGNMTLHHILNTGHNCGKIKDIWQY
jgi:hypothetical protein